MQSVCVHCAQEWFLERKRAQAREREESLVRHVGWFLNSTASVYLDWWKKGRVEVDTFEELNFVHYEESNTAVA